MGKWNRLEVDFKSSDPGTVLQVMLETQMVRADGDENIGITVKDEENVY